MERQPIRRRSKLRCPTGGPANTIALGRGRDAPRGRDQCEGCGEEARTGEEARGWRTFMIVVAEGQPAERVVYCPDCAKREFEDAERIGVYRDLVKGPSAPSATKVEMGPKRDRG
jgi:hypothetical protein